VASRPIIAVTGPDRGGYPAWWFTRRAIRRAGGRAVRVTPKRGAPAHFDGLVIGGGADISPGRYGAEPSPPAERVRWSRSRLRLVLDYALAPIIYVLRRLFGLSRSATAGPDPGRDELELALIARADAAGLPVLGICRGAQLLNVAAGGTLHQDLADFYAERPRRWTVFPRTPVDVEAGTHLAATLGRDRCWVNSLHLQAVDRLGAGLRVAARDDAGVVQAIEHAARRFWIGVQWHPEYLPQVAEERRLFATLVSSSSTASPL
jgi:putative glutamine amidotransferase